MIVREWMLVFTDLRTGKDLCVGLSGDMMRSMKVESRYRVIEETAKVVHAVTDTEDLYFFRAG